MEDTSELNENSFLVLQITRTPAWSTCQMGHRIFGQTCWLLKCASATGIVCQLPMLSAGSITQSSQTRNPRWEAAKWQTLVGGLEHEFYFPIYWEFHHANWLIFFRGVGQPPTRTSCSFLSRGSISLGPPAEVTLQCPRAKRSAPDGLGPQDYVCPWQISKKRVKHSVWFVIFSCRYLCNWFLQGKT